MISDNENSDSGDEIYANAFLHFTTELKLLAEEAEVQCAIKNYDNVAWEIKNFFINSTEIILNLPYSGLSKDQKEGIRKLLADVVAVPNEVVNVVNRKKIINLR